MTPAQRSLYGRIGAAVARSRHDPRELTSEARRVFLQRFERQVREEFPDLPDPEVERRAGERRRAHMLQLAAKSSTSRAAKKRTATRPKVTVQEADRASDRTPTP
jgi:hypothetical protein